MLYDKIVKKLIFFLLLAATAIVFAFGFVNDTFAAVCTPNAKQCPNGTKGYTGSSNYLICNSAGTAQTSVSCGNEFCYDINGTVGCTSGCNGHSGSFCSTSCSLPTTGYYCPSGTGVCCSDAPRATAAPTSPPDSLRWNCNRSTKQCTMAPDGFYVGKINCDNACSQPTPTVTPPPKYRCIENQCVQVGSGVDCTSVQCYTTTTCGGVCNPSGETNRLPGCPVCSEGYFWDEINRQCIPSKDQTGGQDAQPKQPDYLQCSTPICYPGCGCDAPCSKNFNFQPGRLPCTNGTCHTAIGAISTDIANAVKNIFGILLGLAGTVAVILIIYSGYRLMISRGNPEQIQNAREQLTAAIVGLLFVILSFVFLNLIFVKILNIQ